MRVRQTLARWVPALAWAPRYQLAALWSDAFAGVMVGAVVVPQVRPRGAAPKETWRARPGARAPTLAPPDDSQPAAYRLVYQMRHIALRVGRFSPAIVPSG